MCSPGAIAAGVVVTLVVLLLVVAVIAGLAVFIIYQRKASRFDETGATNQNPSGFDNPISKCTLQKCVHYLITLVWVHVDGVNTPIYSFAGIHLNINRKEFV